MKQASHSNLSCKPIFIALLTAAALILLYVIFNHTGKPDSETPVTTVPNFKAIESKKSINTASSDKPGEPSNLEHLQKPRKNNPPVSDGITVSKAEADEDAAFQVPVSATRRDYFNLVNQRIREMKRLRTISGNDSHKYCELKNQWESENHDLLNNMKDLEIALREEKDRYKADLRKSIAEEQ